jgi:hypothetical protein
MLSLESDLTLYFVVLAVFVAVFLFVIRIVHSPYGQVLKAIRENEPRAVSLGYRVERFKLLAFVISASLAGMAGAAGIPARGPPTMVSGRRMPPRPGTGGALLTSPDGTTWTARTSGTTNTNTQAGTSTDTTGSVDGDAGLNAVAGKTTFDGAILQASFIPDGDYLTMQFVFASEEYPEYVASNFNDAFGVWVNGSFVPVSITVAGNVAIDEVNAGKNENLYHSNTTDQFNTDTRELTAAMVSITRKFCEYRRWPTISRHPASRPLACASMPRSAWVPTRMLGVSYHW